MNLIANGAVNVLCDQFPQTLEGISTFIAAQIININEPQRGPEIATEIDYHRKCRCRYREDIVEIVLNPVECVKLPDFPQA